MNTHDARQSGIGAAILDHVLAGIVALDVDGSVSYANSAAAALMGRPAGQCEGLAARELFGSEAAEEILSSTSPAEHRIALVFTRPDGTPLHAGASLIVPPLGAIPNVSKLVVFRELDEQRFATEDLRRWEGQAALGRMVAGLAHELRNPLAAIQGLTQVLMSECAESDPSWEPARRIGELVQRMERLVAACVEAGNPPPPHFETVSARGVIERALQTLSPRWGRNGAAPRLAATDRDARVRVDAAQLAQCVRALVENACDAAGNPGAVAVRLVVEQDEFVSRPIVRIEVHDAGPGIPSALMFRVFEPFYTTKNDRLGLGLPVAQALALRNGAMLQATSRPGDTTFRLSLFSSEEAR